jgi:UDP-N-acetylglucosamine--N-acetylmuramyl-(pentapeptide) pyrophosphoryl-undecaprenol N-acetylglucosamine transferase
MPKLQFLHLTGSTDLEKMQAEYAQAQCRARVLPFLTEMELALGAATVAVSRAGASSLAELAAMRVPAILIPYPVAADNHQFHNARALVETGAARQLDQWQATPESFHQIVIDLLEDEAARLKMRSALERWNSAHAAELVAERMLAFMGDQNVSSLRSSMDQPAGALALRSDSEPADLDSQSHVHCPQQA